MDRRTGRAARPFAGVNALFAAMKAAVDRAPAELRLALIKAHPDLADKTQRAAGLTAESSAEQNSVGLDRLSDAEYEAFERVNNAYRAKFGFPYIVCVRRHTRDSILRDFERRLPNDAATETATSIAEICRIAALRLDQLVVPDDRLPVHGRLSTHVLDTHSGKPAAGIAVELVELSELGASRVVTRAVTNADGRTDQPLIGGRPVPIGRYELIFSVGNYFRDGRCECPIRRSLTISRCVFRSAIRKGISMCRSWSRPGVMRPIAAVNTFTSTCWADEATAAASAFALDCCRCR